MPSDDSPVARGTGRWTVVALGSALFAVVLALSPRWATSGVDAGGSERLYAASRAGRQMASALATWTPPAADDGGAQGNGMPEEEQPPGFREGSPGGDDVTDPVGATGDLPDGPPPGTVDPEATDKEEAAGVEAPEPAPPTDGEEPATTSGGREHDDGSLRLTMGPPSVAGDEPGAAPHDEDWVRWTFTVENAGDEYLWGVYLYLEGYGHVGCGARRLDVGESTQCTAEAEVWQGSHRAEAWVTAWTTDRMVETSATREYVVVG